MQTLEFVHSRRDIGFEDSSRDATEVLTERLLGRPLGDRDICGNAYDYLMQRETRRSEHHEFLMGQAGEARIIFDKVRPGKDVLRAMDGLEVLELARNPA
ncbi:hypothetical protein [Aromatoleum sp.]|uniref:hypothetical protein n=1 Tax=Aromatoleum sp. TaxID=2307007 RepID=UPI002FC8C834